jgi:hypothetical protein
MRVHQSEVVKAQGALASVAPQDAPATSFAAALAKSSASEKPEAVPTGPKGETTRAVPNRGYVEITSGPRNGMFINTSDNARHNEAFVLKKKGDHDLHIYGSGKDRRVVTVPHARGPEHTKPVADHAAYDEITSGPRNGMFINRTSNERGGDAFVLVKKDDRDLHIYGTGPERRVVVSWHKDQPAHAEPAKDANQDSPAESGGTTAPA